MPTTAISEQHRRKDARNFGAQWLMDEAPRRAKPLPRCALCLSHGKDRVATAFTPTLKIPLCLEDWRNALAMGEERLYRMCHGVLKPRKKRISRWLKKPAYDVGV